MLKLPEWSVEHSPSTGHNEQQRQVVFDHEELQEPYLSADAAPLNLVSSSVIIAIALIRLELGKRSLLHDVSKQSGWVKP